MVWLAVLMSMVVLATGCSSSSDWSDQDISNAVSVWINSLGLNQFDEDVWSDRLDAICATDSDLLDLAEQYVAEDAEHSVRADGRLPPPEEAEQILDIIRRQTQTCER